jgi:hypothetical protein
MNELEKALITQSDSDLDAYLDFSPTAKIRADIEDIKQKAADGTDATRKIAAIQKILLENSKDQERQ